MRRLIAAVLAFALIAGCVAEEPSPSPGRTARPTAAASRAAATLGPTTTPDRVAGWRADIDRLLPAMDAIHPDLFHGASEAEMEAAIADLEPKAATATDDELLVGLARIVALVSRAGRDAHTGLYPWSPTSHFPVHSLPLRIWLFPDGARVVAALPPHQDLVGARIDAVGGRPFDDVLAALDPLIPRDNDATVRLLAPRYVLIPEVLHGLGIVDDVERVPLDLTLSDGSRRSFDVDAIPMADYNAWAGPYGLHLPDDPDVLYLSRTQEPIWSTRLPSGTLFVQYNRVEPVRAARIAQVFGGAADRGVRRVVVDIRHNFGGEVSAYRAPLAALQAEGVDRPGRLFLVGGRNSFSAATLFASALEASTPVTIVGEEMGGSPNAWGDASEVVLPWSGLAISVASTFELSLPRDDGRLSIDVDLPTPLTFDAWQAERDPALEAIEALPGG